MTDQAERERVQREIEQERQRIEKAYREAEAERMLREADERARKARDEDDPFKTEQRNR